MAGQRVLLLAGFLLPGFLLSEAAKILTLSLVGGSHHLLLDRVSQILQDHGHNVTMLHQRGNSFISDFKEKEISYQVIPWLPPEDYNKRLKNNFDFFIEEALGGRYTFGKFLKLMEQVGLQCSHFLRRSDIMDSLKNENFDLVIVENFDYCPFLVAEKLRKPFVSILSSSFGAMDFGLPNPLSYVPVLHSLLTDHMDFWGRVKNFLMFFDFTMKQRQIQSAYDNTIKEHFPEGSRPVLSHLLKKAELWFVNSDFALEFARPLLPNTVYVGGLMARPVTPVPQVSETVPPHVGFMQRSSAQNIVLSFLFETAHPRIRLFVTHGGMNSIMEAIQHGVPMVGIPLFGDQTENLVRVEAKKFGVSIPLKQIKEETLAVKMKQVIEDKRYKSAAVAASIIRRSHPLTPAQRLVGWINHILQTGGAAHLKAHALQQPWHEQYLLDIFLLLLVVTLGTLWLCGKLLGMVARWLCGARKLKKA
ncbi:UDP-glucuronosyltransferase 3A2-like [Panthera onca]